MTVQRVTSSSAERRERQRLLHLGGCLDDLRVLGAVQGRLGVQGKTAAKVKLLARRLPAHLCGVQRVGGVLVHLLGDRLGREELLVLVERALGIGERGNGAPVLRAQGDEGLLDAPTRGVQGRLHLLRGQRVVVVAEGEEHRPLRDAVALLPRGWSSPLPTLARPPSPCCGA